MFLEGVYNILDEYLDEQNTSLIGKRDLMHESKKIIKTWKLSIHLLISLVISLHFSKAFGFLLALPPGEISTPLRERALVTYDPLSETQTVITQVAIEGAPSSFGILILIPSNSLKVTYTTTSIWRALKPFTHSKELWHRTLKMNTYSWLYHILLSEHSSQFNDKNSKEVLRSTATDSHSSEADMHQWLLGKGLSLTPNEALAVKEAYRAGLSILTLWVKRTKSAPATPHPPSDVTQPITPKEIWTSTWIYTTPTKRPYYLSLAPRSIHPRLDLLPRRYSFEINILTEGVSQARWRPKRERLFEEGEVDTESLDDHSLTSILPFDHYRSISRREVNRLNAKLRSTFWSFKRSGILTHYVLEPQEGMSTLDFQLTDTLPKTSSSRIIREQVHKVDVPIEVILSLLYGLWWLWFRYARRIERRIGSL